jgi:hypothetical protein
MFVKNANYIAEESLHLPVVVDFKQVKNARELEIEKELGLSFRTSQTTLFTGKGSWVLLDFGKELCGGLRFITRAAENTVSLHIRFGESMSEAMTPLGVKNAGNDHSPRDIQVTISNLSDLVFGQTGFRFAYVELLDDSPVLLRNIYAVNRTPYFEHETKIETSDSLLNKILETAAYTLKLCCQNGHIWDGIKRDRLVWAGDLHQEILTAYHLFGDIPNITASLDFLKGETSPDEWMNDIPSYSMWWVICLCDYCRLSGNTAYFDENLDYAKAIVKKVNACIEPDGTMVFENTATKFFFDLPTFETEDAIIGTAAVGVLMANKLNAMVDNTDCKEIIRKLNPYLSAPCNFKQIRAFQVLAGGDQTGAVEFLEKNGAEGFSTFMAYYILTADALAGGSQMLTILKEYFGGMLSRGATTFWEDFNISWLDGSGRIDRLPTEEEKDIHGDYGYFCCKNFRHSLCHGWSSGVYSFVAEYILGIIYSDKGISFDSHPMGIQRIHAQIPHTPGGVTFDL